MPPDFLVLSEVESLGSTLQADFAARSPGRSVVNNAGLYADRIAGELGFSKDFRILPFEGLYLSSSEPAGSIRTNILYGRGKPGIGLPAYSNFEFKMLAAQEMARYSKSKKISLASELAERISPSTIRTEGNSGAEHNSSISRSVKRKREVDFVLEIDRHVCERIPAVLN